jgi:hypothetical protein
MKSLFIVYLIAFIVSASAQSPRGLSNDPRKEINSAAILKRLCILSVATSQSIITSKAYLNSLGRVVCYDNDSSGKIYYTGRFSYYDSSKIVKQFVGFHKSGRWFKEDWEAVFHDNRLVEYRSCISDYCAGVTYYTYDNLGREIMQVWKSNDSPWVRIMIKQYVGNTNKIAEYKDSMIISGIGNLDSHRKFVYERGKLIRDIEYVTNSENSSNTNQGNSIYKYNKDGRMAHMIVSETLNYEFDYYPDGLLKTEKFYITDNFPGSANMNRTVVYTYEKIHHECKCADGKR